MVRHEAWAGSVSRGVLVLSFLLAASAAEALIFTVNNVGDGVDVAPGNGVCATATATCTLRAAIMEANATAIADTIRFNIAGGGPHTITPGSALPNIIRPVTIDGTTEPDYGGTPVVELNGTSAGGTTNGLNLAAGSGGSFIRGLCINRFGNAGITINASNGNTVEANFLGTDTSGTLDLGNNVYGVQLFGGASSNVIGSGNVISGNNVNGVDMTQAGTSNNRIIGNIVGLDASGGSDVGNTFVGVAIGQGASGNIIGELGAGNVISGNNQHGVRLVDGGTSNNRVQSNYIGLDITGSIARANNGDGVRLETSPVVSTGNVIGGTTLGLGNVISGNGGAGIGIFNFMTGTLIAGNVIGRDAGNTAAVGNAGAGIVISSATNNNTTIGGLGADDPNVIASNTGDGIAITGTATGIAILSNSIFSNGGLGIDLANDGVTANDIGDGDTGPNNRQNFVVLSAAMTNGVIADVAGSLNSAPSATYRVELFAGSAPDPTGNGEGTRYLGFLTAVTNAAGNAVFGGTLAAVVAAGEFVSATVTDSSNNTSEFSGNVVASGSLIVTTTADTVDGTTTSVAALITNPGADGRISLREAILATNATVGADTIRFGIPLSDGSHLYYRNDSLPGSLSLVATTTRADADITDFDPDYPAGLTRSWYRIQPTSALPTITDPVILDGSTQPGSIAGGPVIELDGSLAGAFVDGLQLSAGSSAVSALVINGFQGYGLRLLGPGGDSITGNYIGTNPAGTAAIANGADGITIQSSNNTVGGTTAAARNVVSGNVDDGIEITGAAPTANVIQGNYVGLDATGTAAVGNGNDGIVVWLSRNNTLGGTAAGAGNVVGGNQSGFYFGDITATGNAILGNFIGTNAAGTAAVGNITGIYLDAAGTTVGGTTMEARNVISGNSFTGLWIAGANGVVAQGNYVGTAADGTTPLPNGVGIYLNGGANNNTIGGAAAGAANRIARNTNDGVELVAAAGAGNQIVSNEIYSNGGLGIDLNGDGVSANDALDTDVGPNSLVNFPDQIAAIESGGSVTVYFNLDVPAGSYRIEFFKNPSGADPSGNGEGQVFVGSTNVLHPGGGTAPFSHALPGALGDIVTATATFCADGATCAVFSDTSEFGPAATAVTTAVELKSFTAVGGEESVELLWETGSELNNLGFHLYRSLSPSGPYERITESVIPGLGSSPSGRSYAFRDSSLVSGVTYFYKLEDIETTGGSALHGPVSATPEEEEVPASEKPRRAYGDPSQLSLSVLESGPGGALLELVTGGFFATPLGDGTVRLEVPGLEELESRGTPALPVKRAWLDAVAGRKVRIVSVRAIDSKSIPGLRPETSGSPEIVAFPDGTVRAGRRRGRLAPSRAGIFPSPAARVIETGFQGEVKKVLLELAPLRWDGSSGQLLWARRLQVRLSFAGVEPSERAFGVSRGRRHREGKSHAGRSVVARLTTSEPGLHRVWFKDVVEPGKRSLAPSSIRLSRRGEMVPFHAEPSALYFVGEADAVYELEWRSGGRMMPVQEAAATGPPVSSYLHRSEWEENRYYQAGLLDAPSLWLWDVLLSRGSKSFPFTIDSMTDRGAKLEVHLQGASDFEAAEDHHVRVSVNGIEVGEARWDGKLATTMEALLAPGVLRVGENEMSVENVGDTGAAYSMVFLDRYALTYARPVVADAGRLEGGFDESGRVTFGRGRIVVQTSPETTWLRGTNEGSFRVEAGQSYLAVSPDAVLEPKVRKPSASGLRIASNRADYLVIGPRELLPAAEPLLRSRRSQGLLSRAVAIEEIYDEFGYGEPGPEAVKTFLEYAYHHWRRPSVRYVVLLGDATYDAKDYLRTGVVNRVPTPLRKTSYLWTASDPSYAAVNGDDVLPDLALGRLPAASVAEARLLVEKVIAYEKSGQSLSGPAVLVADDPDPAGDFEAGSEEIASLLPDREVRRIYLRERGAAATRTAILESFDAGASLVSYVGHGGIALWASENVLASEDARILKPQARQPIVMTMNCLNGYFHFPYFDALGEALLKAEAKGAIAAFSPSGLSLDAPARLYQMALVEELTSGRHRRLGDAVLAAQRTYAESGAFPELLAIYHLFGDPALEIR